MTHAMCIFETYNGDQTLYTWSNIKPDKAVPRNVKWSTYNGDLLPGAPENWCVPTQQRHALSPQNAVEGWEISKVTWGFPENGGSKNGWFIRENPIKIYDLGYPYFRKPPHALNKH